MNINKQTKILSVIYIAFAVLTALSPAIVAEDIGSTWDTDSKITLDSEGARFNFRDIRQSGVSILGNNQGDVGENTELVINFTHTEGLGDLEYANISAWFDSGNDDTEYQGTNGGNNRFMVGYDNSSGSETWSLISNHPNDEIQLNSTLKTYQNSTTVNWTVSLTWGYQLHHALSDSGAKGVFDSPNTWNVNWTLQSDGYPSINKNDEFGIYKYVYLSTSGDVTGTGTPGTTIDQGTDPNMQTTVAFRANDRFNLSVQINSTFDDGDLTTDDGEHHIPVTNVGVSTTWLDGIGSYTNFASLGEPIILNTERPKHPYENGTEQTFVTRWEVEIPFGQYSTTYDTQIAYMIEVDSGF